MMGSSSISWILRRRVPQHPILDADPLKSTISVEKSLFSVTNCGRSFFANSKDRSKHLRGLSKIDSPTSQSGTISSLDYGEPLVRLGDALGTSDPKALYQPVWKQKDFPHNVSIEWSCSVSNIQNAVFGTLQTLHKASEPGCIFIVTGKFEIVQSLVLL